MTDRIKYRDKIIIYFGEINKEVSINDVVQFLLHEDYDAQKEEHIDILATVHSLVTGQITSFLTKPCSDRFAPMNQDLYFQTHAKLLSEKNSDRFGYFMAGLTVINILIALPTIQKFLT